MDASTFSSLLKERLAKSGSTSAVWVAGTCMAPLLVPGMRLRLVALASDEPVVGRVYVFRGGDRLFVHRCVTADRRGAFFKGDRHVRAAKIDSLDAIVGRVASVTILGASIPIDGLAGRLLAATNGLALALYRRLPRRIRSSARVFVRRGFFERTPGVE